VSASHAFESALVATAFGALGRMSWPAALRTGAAIGAAAGGLGIRRGVARANLALAFPERPIREREAILARHYRELGRIAAEYGRMPRLVHAADGEVMAGVEGLEPLRALAGRGAVLLTGHLGNFEFGAAWLAKLNPVDFLVRPLSNRAVDRRIERLRRDAGVGTISTHGGVKQIFRALRSGRWIAIAADQDAGRHGLFVPFFGRPASTAEGAARIALQMRVPMVVGAMRRVPDGRHHLAIEPPHALEGPADEANVLALTAWHTSVLERRVREAPEHYFWLHRRWKTRPHP
jgi:KDO2-lipid IV(A) lauroyltransferase